MAASHRSRGLRWLALLAVALMFGGCNPVLRIFAVPNRAQVGSDFVVTVSGEEINPHQPPGWVGCVLQLPPGFSVVGYGPGVRNDPGMLAIWAREPGHTLASLSGTASTLNAGTHFVVRAGPVTGPYVLKVGLGGTPGSTSPPGVTSFAAITSAPHVATIFVEPGEHHAFVVEPPPVANTNTRFAELGDVDRDGRADLILGRGPRVLLARPGLAWTEVSPPSTTSTDEPVACGDFDGDGHLDFVHGSRGVYFGDGAGNWSPSVLPPPTGSCSALATGDFDADGCDDIALCVAGQTVCHRGAANRTFTGTTVVAAQPQTELVFADLDGDGDLDLAGNRTLWRGDGTGVWSGVTLPPNMNHVAVGDLVGDSRPEILLSQSLATTFSVLTHAGGAQWNAVAIPGLDNRIQGDVETLDFDSDGDLDILSDGPLLTLNRGDGTFGPVPLSGLPVGGLARTDWLVPMGNALGDVDGDSDLDLVVSPGTGSDWVPFLFRNRVTNAVPYGSSCSATGHSAPMLRGSGGPRLGNAAFALRLTQGPPSGVGLVSLGWSRLVWNGQLLPMSLARYGAPDCTLLADPLAFQLYQLDGSGAAAAPLPIPNDPRLRGAIAHGQGAVFAPSANALGLLTTNGLTLLVE